MALSQRAKGKTLFSRLKSSLFFQRFQHIYVEDLTPAQLSAHTGQVATSKCVKLDSVKLGIKRSMISPDSYKVVKDLQIGGFETYLVGGCVRDLLLNKVPKDFDVITTAKLEKVKRMFRKAIIVGKRFPVCRVCFKYSVVEVASFGTIDKLSKRKKLPFSQISAGCNQNDLTRWNDCMMRDFTINSLLYDPFNNTIFDYTGAMKDLRSLKLRTIIPATQSFKEDQARILRGLRIAGRLKLSFSEETEAAIHDLSQSVAEISTPRLLMEINYMLSYGAAETSLLLLKRFKLLEIFLPFQAAYLSKLLDSRIDPCSLMLMKLLFNLDQLITCDKPCHGSLWVALLSFHMALFNYPQPAEVVLTFASLLYHGKWERSIEFARQHAPGARICVPEILTNSVTLSDDEIADRVTLLAEQASNSANILTNKARLIEAMARFPESPSFCLILIPQKMGKQAEDVFKVPRKNATHVKAGRSFMRIDYTKLGEGYIAEMRFVLGQIIIDTLVSNATAKREPTKVEKVGEQDGPEQLLEVLQQIRHTPTDPRKGDSNPKKGNKRIRSPSNNERLPDNTRKARVVGDDSNVTEVILSGKMGSKSPDFRDRNLASRKIENDKHVKR